jgi:hypothetical protein
MAAMTKEEFAVALGWVEKNVGGRLAALGLLVTCGRCLGSGKGFTVHVQDKNGNFVYMSKGAPE